MIRALTAYTLEIDEPEVAVAEILGQLQLDQCNLQNRIGLISCYPEFVDSGVFAALCEALPFDVVGTTTLGNATGDEASHLMLTLMVIASDDVYFSAQLSSTLTKEPEDALKQVYSAARAALPVDPVFMITYMPLMNALSGEVMVKVLSDATAGLPIFGTVAVDHTVDYHASFILHNGKSYTDALALVLVGGNAQPEFMIESVDEGRSIQQKAIITDADAHILKSVNGISAIDYLSNLGMVRDGKIEGANTMPFVVDFGDGAKPAVRAIFAHTPEGYAVCGASMPVNATLGIGELSYQTVMDTASHLLTRIAERKDCHVALLFSCVGRNYALGMQSLDELKSLKTGLGSSMQYQATYSGGESCPLMDGTGKLVNRFHNDSLIACIF